MSFDKSWRAPLRGGTPKLLYLGTPQHGYTPDAAWMVANPTRLSGSAFDGVLFLINPPGDSSGIFSTTSFSAANFNSAFTGLSTANFGACTFNMPVVYMEDPNFPGDIGMPPDLDYTNNTLWANIVSNWGNLATACAGNPNIGGICLDNEAYGGGWNGSTHPFPWDYRSDLNSFGATGDGSGIFDSSLTWAQARDWVHQRGKECMNAVIAAWPTAKVLMLHSPADGMPETTAAYAPMEYNDVSPFHELHVGWYGGMVEACADVGYTAQIIDGGEIYQCQTRDEAYRMGRWRQRLRTESVAYPFKSTVASRYRTINAVGIWDQAFSSSTPDPPTIQARIKNVMRGCDLAWLYTEAHSSSGSATNWDLLGVAGAQPSSTILNAVRDGALAGKGQTP